jgi:hypothetical protein
VSTERAVQFVLAAFLIISAGGLVYRAIEQGNGLWSATIVGALMVVGAVVLGQDRPVR